MVRIVSRPPTVTASLPPKGQGTIQAAAGAGAELANLTGDAGFTPLEFLDAALAGCLVLSVRAAARKFGWQERLGEVSVEVTHEKAHEGPSRVAALECVFQIAGDFTPDERERLIAEAHVLCTVGNTLSHGAILRDRPQT